MSSYDFKLLNKNPLSYITSQKLVEGDIQKILEEASYSYYNSEIELLNDKNFDIVRDYLEENYPDNLFLKIVGAPIQGKYKKVKLPVFMGSMNKKKKEEDVVKWQMKYPGPYVISDKLDGISFLLTKKNGNIQLLTRGNGVEGKDISHLLKYLSMPKINLKEFIIRGEMLVSKSNFKKLDGKFSNGRSFIAGLSNLKSVKPEYTKLIDLVCYELIEPVKKPSEQLQILKKYGLQVVYNKVGNVNFKMLEAHLIERKEKSDYDIDGIIVCQDKINVRKEENPKHAFAFKMDLEFAVTKVIKVEWNASKHGKLKPIVHIEKVNLCGTINSKATGNNADFIQKHKIGKGAIVRITKGGEIIPKVEEVIKPAIKAEFPDDLDYYWNDSHKEIILKNILESDTVKQKKLLSFFKIIGVEGLGPGLIKKLYESGINTIRRISLVKKEELLELDGIKERSANKLVSNIRKILDEEINIVKVIVGTCLLGDGIGEKILEKIFLRHPNYLQKYKNISLKDIDGIEEKTEKKIVKGVPLITQFLKENDYLKLKLEKKNKINKNTLFNGKVFVLTGKRHPNIINFIEKNGGKIGTSVNSNTYMVLMEEENGSSKIKNAKKLNIEVCLNSDFIKKNNIV